MLRYTYIVILTFLIASAFGSSATAGTEPIQVTNSTLDTVFDDVLSWGIEEGVITKEQQATLQHELSRRLSQIREQPGAFRPGKYRPDPTFINPKNTIGVISRTLRKISGPLTVLNVLYFGGGLIILAGMTLLMAVGWEALGGGGIFFVSAMYFGAFVLAGQSFWHKEGWETVGGIFHVSGLGMVPLGTYGLLKFLRLWDESLSFHAVFEVVQPQFVILELSTIVIGTIMTYYVRFSFLVAPISVALWFLSMDMSPIIFSRGATIKQRGVLSVIFGVSVLSLAYWVDVTQESADFSFWLFLSGCFAFSGGFILLEPPRSLKYQTTLICSHMGLMYLGSVLDRTTLTLFGAIGVAITYVVMIINPSERKITKLDAYVRIASAIILLGLSLHADTEFKVGHTAYLLALLGFGAFNAAFVRMAKELSEGAYLTHLVLSVGVLACSPLFEGRVFDVYFHQFDASYLLVPSGAIGIVGNSLMALFFELQQGKHRNTYCVYRVILAVLVSLLTLGLPWRPIGLVWAGVFSVLEYTWIAFAWKLPNFDKDYHLLPGHFINTLVAVILAASFDLRFPFVVSVGVGAWVLVLAHKHWKRIVAPLALLAIVIGVIIDSKLLVVVGSVFLLRFIAHLAFKIFKNSLLFPFALVAIGLGVIFVGIQYQTHHAAIRDALFRLINLDQVLESVVEFFSTFSQTGNKAFVLVGWVAGTVNALAIDITWIPFLIFGLYLAPVFADFVRSLFAGEAPILDPTPKLSVSDFSISFPRDTGGHGLVLTFLASKPADFTIDSATLSVEGDAVWSVVNDLYGAAQVQTLISGLYPLKLFPNRMSKSAVPLGSDSAQGVIQIGTGLKGEPKVSHATIRSLLRKLVNSGDPVITLKIVYKRKSKVGPPQGVLFTLSMKSSKALNSIKEDLNIQDSFKNW